MGILADRSALLAAYLAERVRGGLTESVGPLDREVVFLLDGVSGYQAGVLMIRRVLRELDADVGTVLFDWQTPLRPDIFTDLMWLRRNRWMGLRLARRLLAFRRAHSEARIHLFAFSGGAGIAVFACETLAGRSRAHRQDAGAAELIDTLVLACPAMSPDYNLSAALRTAQQAYVLVSPRDTFMLGLGTRLFGTTDRRFCRAAGLVGFHRPKNLAPEDAALYRRLREIRWTPDLRKLNHHGGHVGWGSPSFLRAHLLPLIRGRPKLPTRPVP